MAAEHSLRTAVRFDVFEADFRAGELRKRGVKVKLQEQPLQILRMLLEHPGEIVTREQLRQKIWPADTFVDFEQGLYNSVRRLRAALKDTADKPRFIETLSRRGYRFIGIINASARQIRSLAVLPLENLSRDPEQEYFADGLTEALINSLARIGELRVASRTSVMQYGRVHKPLRGIALELEVDAIVEGTVLRVGHRVRITARLMDAANERNLWSESYERDLRDVLALHAEVAQAIAREIRIKLTSVDRARMATPRPVSPAAYEAYLRGRYHWNQHGGLRKAIYCFQQAIEKDSTYAPAYAGLADCFSTLNAFALAPASEGCIKAQGLALKALEIDHSSAEAHTALAYASIYQYDFLTSEREFERAIELNPRYFLAHHLFGWYLCTMDRYEEAYTELQRAIRLDPLFSLSHVFLGVAYFYGRRYDQALEQCRKTLALDPHSGPAQVFLGWMYSLKSLHELAITALRKACDLWPGSTVIGMLGEAYAAGGRCDEALKVLEQLDQLSKERYVTPYVVGRIYAALGQHDEAFRWLEIAYQQRAEWMILLKVDPGLDRLRPDPRFQDLLRRMNFPA